MLPWMVHCCSNSWHWGNLQFLTPRTAQHCTAKSHASGDSIWGSLRSPPGPWGWHKPAALLQGSHASVLFKNGVGVLYSFMILNNINNSQWVYWFYCTLTSFHPPSYLAHLFETASAAAAVARWAGCSAGKLAGCRGWEVTWGMTWHDFMARPHWTTGPVPKMEATRSASAFSPTNSTQRGQDRLRHRGLTVGFIRHLFWTIGRCHGSAFSRRSQSSPCVHSKLCPKMSQDVPRCPKMSQGLSGIIVKQQCLLQVLRNACTREESGSGLPCTPSLTSQLNYVSIYSDHW